jgi:DNA-binding IclR family transcriptional regulator
MAILEQNEIVYINKIESEMNAGGLKMSSRVGSRTPANSCAVGKVLLSYLSPDEIDRIIQATGLSQRTAYTITDPTRLKEHLAAVRKQEYAIDDEENELGIRCVAAPLFGDKGNAVSAISLSGPAFRVTKKLIQETLRKEVMRAASEISQLLGYTGAK